MWSLKIHWSWEFFFQGHPLIKVFPEESPGTPQLKGIMPLSTSSPTQEHFSIKFIAGLVHHFFSPHLNSWRERSFKDDKLGQWSNVKFSLLFLIQNNQKSFGGFFIQPHLLSLHLPSLYNKLMSFDDLSCIMKRKGITFSTGVHAVPY